MTVRVRVPLKVALAEARKKYPQTGSPGPRSMETRRRMSESKKALYAARRREGK